MIEIRQVQELSDFPPDVQKAIFGVPVRVRGGKPIITDGPFAETKEQLAGFYLIKARDFDAIGIALKMPPAR
ncbi:MAG TPA: YciI family protein, partial [Gemmatimonadales bacterium]|nr:YciI family protein [Gemmatimonadales bacterium]